MFITVIAVIVALALGHLIPVQVAALRSFDWFGRWLAWIGRLPQTYDLWQTSYGLWLALAPLLFGVMMLQWWLDGVWHGLFSLLFGVAVVSWTWGPRDLDRDVEAVFDANDASARHLAVKKLQAAGGACMRISLRWLKLWCSTHYDVGWHCCSGFCCWGLLVRSCTD